MIEAAVLLVCFLSSAPLIGATPKVEAPGCRLEFSFELDGSAAEGALSGALRLRPADSEDWFLVEVEKGTAVAELERGKSSFIEVQIPGYWGPSQILNIAEDCTRRQHEIPLWAIGRLSGKVTIDDGKPRQSAGAMPDELIVRLRSTSTSKGRRAVGRVHCGIDEETSTWTCALPSGSLDLVFTAEGFAPVYRKQVLVESGASRRLDDMKLRPGASLAGFVEVEEGQLSSRCRARIRPMEIGPTSREGTEFFAKQSTGVDERGFFQLTGLAPGSYLLEIEQPGFAPQRVFPLDLVEGQETFLRESVTLRRPLDIEILISPPLDWLESPWMVSVMRASSQSSTFEDAPLFEGPADTSGRVFIPEESPGRYALSILDSEGNAFHSDVLLQIPDRSALPVRVELDLIVVEGEVTLGESPVSGQLIFGGRHGFRSIKVPIDADGFFQGVLPEEGVWNVDVEALSPELNTAVEVEVEVGPGGKAFLDVELPDTLVFGRVVDEVGRPVEKARVAISTELGSISDESDETGDFELLAIPGDLGWVSAKISTPSGRLTSESVAVSITEGQPFGPVVLRMLENRTVHGLVSGPRGPIAGADVRLRPAGTSIPISIRTKTDIDGTFLAELPAKARQVEVVVSGPGHALKALEVQLPEEEDGQVELVVPARGGTLLLSSPPRASDGSEGWRLDVLQDGRLISFQTLFEWAMAHGGELNVNDDRATEMRIPQMAAGRYRACLRPRRAESYGQATDPVAEITERLREEGDCFEGFLSEGAQLSHRFTLD